MYCQDVGCWALKPCFNHGPLKDVFDSIIKKQRVCFNGSLLGQSCGFSCPLNDQQKLDFRIKLINLIELSNCIYQLCPNDGYSELFSRTCLKNLLLLDEQTQAKLISNWYFLLKDIKEPKEMLQVFCHITWTEHESLSAIMPDLLAISNGHERAVILFSYYRISPEIRNKETIQELFEISNYS